MGTPSRMSPVATPPDEDDSAKPNGNTTSEVVKTVEAEKIKEKEKKSKDKKEKKDKKRKAAEDGEQVRT